MKKFRKLLAAGLTMALCVGMMSGCGSSESSSSEETAEETTEEVAEETAAQADEETAAESTGDGTRDTITIGVDSSWGDISPFGSVSAGRTLVASAFYEGLAVRSEFGALLEDMELVGAKEITQIDDLTYQAVMYDYITDSEGNAITAEDYAWAATTMRDTGNYEKLSSYLESVTAIDDYTVEIKLTSNALGIIEYIVDIIPLISQEAYEASEDGMSTLPVATGPYIVEEMIPGSSMTLVKNENYWQTDESAVNSTAAQNIDTIVYKIVTEASQMSTALQTGEIDVAEYLDTSALSTFYADGAAVDGYDVYVVDNPMLYSLLPNMSEDSVVSQSVELREAIYYAIDADALVTAAVSGYGSSVNAMAISICADYLEEWDERDYYSYNPETAKEKLEESGVDLSGVTLKILTMPVVNLDRVAEVIQAYLAEVGINSEIVSVEDALYQTYKLDSTQFDLIIDIKGTDDFVTFPWGLIFDADSYGGETANFISDDTLQELYQATISLETHGDESIGAFEEYLEENAYAYGLYTSSKYIVTTEGTFSELSLLRNTYIIPNACSY